MDVSLSELRETVMDTEAWRAVIHGVAKSRTRLSDWTDWTTGFSTYYAYRAARFREMWQIRKLQMISKDEFSVIRELHNMWDVLHLTGYIVGVHLWVFCCPLTRGIWDREIALWFLSSWAQLNKAGGEIYFKGILNVFKHFITQTCNSGICYRTQVMCICGELASLFFFFFCFTFKSNSALVKEVLSFLQMRKMRLKDSTSPRSLNQ